MVTEGEGYGTTLLPLDDALRERTDEDGYADSNAAFTGVSCADYTGRFTTDDVRRHLPEFRRASAVVGNWMAWSLLHCTCWPVAGHAPTVDVTVDGEGDGTYGVNDCLTGLVDKYLLDGTVPRNDTTCS